MNKYLILLFAIYLWTGCQKYDDISPSNLSVKGGETILFEAFEIPSRKKVYWDFGDGNFSEEMTPEHAYKSPGNYKVTYSLYGKNNRFITKVHRFNVEVEQNFRPRVLGAEVSTSYSAGDYDFLYKDKETYLAFIVPENIENEDSIQYEISVDGQLIDTLSWTNYTFTDTGFYDLEFKVIDEYGGSGSYDTTVFVGADQTKLNINLPEVYLSQLGTVSEKYFFVYDSQYSFQFDYNDMINYPGPSIGSFLSGGEHMYYYGPGPNDYFYSSLGTLSYKSLPAISNGMTDQITIPAYDDYNDIDELYVLVVIVGSNGMSIGYEQLNILPGSSTPSYEIGLDFVGY